MQSCSKGAGSRLKKYRRPCGLCGSDLISQLYQRFRERRPVMFTTRCTTVCAWQKIGVASVILQPTKTAISLAAMSSLQGTLPCFITLTPNILNLTLTLITGGAVAEWVRALDWRPDGPGFESHCGKLFASELWQFRLPHFASVFRRRH